MSTINASKLLRPGLLDGVSILIAGAPVSAGASGSLGDAVRDACAGLGASVCECDVSGDVPGSQEEGAIEQAVEAAVERASADGARVDLLVVDCASLFARVIQRDGDAREALRLCLDLSWNATRAVVNAAFLPSARGGRVVYLAPPADAGEHADAARAGLENLARTLSIEWARHRITPVTIAPGAASDRVDSAGEMAALTAYLASPAGAYFSGCLLDLSRSSPRTGRR
jgi:NAD(P)-dependent dehydrogenase (short-subunit alcohol dehydrogenase family)